MKIISAIQNAFSGKSATETPASQPTSSTFAVPPAQNFRAGTNPPPTNVDAFDEKFSRKPYLSGYWRNQQFSIPNPPAITPEIFLLIMDRAGGVKSLFEKSAAEKMKIISTTWDNLAGQLAEHSWVAVGQKFRDQIATMDENLMAGKAPPRLQSRDENLASVVEARKRIHELQRGLCHDVFEIIKPACLKLQEVAREMVSETDAAENGHAEELGIAFEPSLYLRTLAFFAVRVATAPISNYVHGSGFLPPEADLEKIWSCHVTPKQSQIVEQSLYSKPKTEPRRLFGNETSAEREARERSHADKVAEVNTFNDAIRNQPQK